MEQGRKDGAIDGGRVSVVCAS